MIVHFYNFTKKENSTSHPDPTLGSILSNVMIKSPTDVLNPVLEIESTYVGGVSIMPDYNYAYINEWQRFYWVTDVTAQGPKWLISLSVDVLASYKSAIGNFSGYVLRSSHSYNGYIKDELYPTKAAPTKAYQVTNEPFMRSGATHITTQQGCFVVGVINNTGSNAAKYGSVFYVVMDKAALATLSAKALTDCVTASNNFDFTEASQSLQNSIVNPLQFIATVVWFPFDVSTIAPPNSQISTLKLFDWDISMSGLNCYALTSNPPVHEVDVTIPLQPHPQSTARGWYLNAAPFTELILTSGAFGSFALDANMLAGDANLTLNYKIDLISGSGILTAYGTNATAAQVKTQVGVPIQLSQVTRDYIGTTTSAIGAGASLAAGILTGNIAGAIMGMATGIGDAVQSSAAKVLSVGSNGGFSDLDFKTRLDYIFYLIADEDLNTNGRPLCQIKQLSTIPGYIKVEKADIALNCYYSELTQVMNYMENGFYYE